MVDCFSEGCGIKPLPPKKKEKKVRFSFFFGIERKETFKIYISISLSLSNPSGSDISMPVCSQPPPPPRCHECSLRDDCRIADGQRKHASFGDGDVARARLTVLRTKETGIS